MPVSFANDINYRNRISKCCNIFVYPQGYVQSIDALALGKVILELGAGRSVAGADIDYSVGFRLLVKVGSQLKKGG